MWGRSFEETVLPYQPFVEMLSQYFTGADPQELGWLSGAVRRQLARLVPEACVRGGRGTEGVSEDGDRHRLFEAVSAFMSGVSFGSPVLLVLDDLQWADPASLLLLKSLVLDQRAASIMVLGVYRDTDVRPSHPLARVLADIERERDIDHLTLGGLDVSDVGEMLRAVIPSPVPPDLAPSIWEDTAGNPFYAEELVYHVETLGTAGDTTVAARHRLAIPPLGVPRRLRDRLGRRLQRLPAPTVEALAAAAVIGPSFGLDVLGHVLSTGRPQLVAMMDEAVRAGLISEVVDRTGRYRFRHPIVGRALCDHHTANQRALIHARVAKAIDRRRPEHHTGTPRAGRQSPRAVGSSSVGVRRGPTPTIATIVGGFQDTQRTPVPPAVASR
jgi:predicted ATPase